MMARAAHAILLAWGWRRALIALVAGALSALAFAPFNIWPVMFVTLPIAVLLIDGAAAGRWGGLAAAALSGWWFGFGFFLAGLYWVGYAFLVDADQFGWLLPIAVTLLPAGLALFMALGFALARVIWTKDAGRILALAAALTLSEYLRGHILTGFPWNALGYSLAGTPALAQNAAFVGLWGLTFCAVAIFASPICLIDSAASKQATRRPLALALIALAALAVIGVVRLHFNPTLATPNVRLRIMQPNVQQDQKFNYAAKGEVMRKYLALSDRATGPQSAGVKDATVLIWPESAFPFFLAREPDALAQIAALLPKGTTLITGGVRPPALGSGARHAGRAYNSIYLIDHEGTILSAYDKIHLVPFGEYLPFQQALESLGLQQLTKLQGGYIPGDRRRAMDIPGAPKVLPLICYEVIFPGAVAQAGERASWIVNVTNDGWFGISSGPYQHLQQARLRAIEEGLPIARAANTGISAMIDPLGRIVAQLPLGSEGVFDTPLPQPLPAPPYKQVGDWPVFLALAATALWLQRRRRGQ